jgi:outer membrane protein insertion porin family
VGIDDDVRITDRFYLGGSSLRGFATYGAGPRDTTTDDALGGNWYYNNTIEVSFPLGLPNEFGIRGRVFNDIGSIGEVDVTSVDTNDTGSLRAAAGVGVSWKSPFGPVSMDIARAYLKEDFDDLEIVRFNFGTRF